ncbi:uncharacterized protein LOC107272829 [Cephus cinctus]|uniref:Uncharacterized protein LOC107272829 n=1 Tax=Cephus cinctus TaxID=211228 RepID=A0AAJ7FSC0_CEPCN|nr:uncharacterized protein LOC107272829 [Cephus cinctus]
MTMEDRSGGVDRAAPAIATTTSSTGARTTHPGSDASYPLQRSSKRSFDVAFLVAPDENLARRQSEKLRLVSSDRLVVEGRTLDREEPEVPSERDSERFPQNLTITASRHYTENSLSPPYLSPRLTATLPGLSPESGRSYAVVPRTQKTPSPPSLLGVQRNPAVQPMSQDSQPGITGAVGATDRAESRSAFTKVAFANQQQQQQQQQSHRNGFEDGQMSPRSSVSPDRSNYRNSVSPPVVSLNGPPTSYKYASFPNKMSYPFLMSRSEPQQNNLLENLKIPRISQPPKVPSPKLPGFRPDLPAVYPNLPYNPISVFPPMAEALTRPRFLATAGVAGLLPPSFAALTLPAQNVCAKCNLSFRMTSDLVYHMRSHHKHESTGEAARRRREEKLRCPVCDESFRERHHLTRHMTAHQDKESDAIVDHQVETKRRTAPVHGK